MGGFSTEVERGDVVLGVDYQHLDHDLDKAERRFHQSGDRMARNFDDHSKRIGRSAGVMGSGISKGLVAGAAGFFVLEKAIGSAFGELRESEKVSAITEARIKSTGGAAKISAKQIDELATAQMRRTGIDDEAIKSGENMLLTFTKIHNETGKGKDIFNQATEALLNMSVSGFGTPEKAAVRLGKALNDPIHGMSALKKVGIEFDDQQKASIKRMQEAGDMAGAQKVILDELAKEMGGTAVAAGEAFGGQMNLAKEELNNLGAEAVKGTLPALTKVLGFVNEKGIPALRDFAHWTGEEIVPRVKTFGQVLIRELRPAVVSVVDYFRDHWPEIKATIRSLVEWARDNLWPLFKDLLKLGKQVIGALTDLWREHREQIRTIVGGIKTVLEGIIIVLREVVMPYLKIWVEGVKKYLGFVIDRVADVILAIRKIVEAARWVFEHISEPLSGVKTAIKAIGTIAEGAADVFTTAFKTLHRWLRNTFAKVLDVIAGIVGGLADKFGWVPGVGGKFKDAAKGIEEMRDQLLGIKRNAKQEVRVDVKFVPDWITNSGNPSVDNPDPRSAGGAIDPGELVSWTNARIDGEAAAGGRRAAKGAYGAPSVPTFNAGPTITGRGKGGPPIQGWNSLSPTLWDEFQLYRQMMPGQTDLGTYNPDSPGDHAVFPAKAFDAGFVPTTGWGNLSARRFFYAMVNRPGIKYAILGGNIWSKSHETPGRPGSGIHPYIHNGSYNSSDHADHVHVSGYRGGGRIVPGPSDRDGTLAWLSGGEAVLTGDGQRRLNQQAPGLLENVLGRQLPHFRTGGRAGGGWRTVGATAFGWKLGDGEKTGYRGDALDGTISYAELGDGHALGDLPYKHPLMIRNPATGKTVKAIKLDIGHGGSPIPGVGERAIDLWQETMWALGHNGWGPVEIAEVGTPADTPTDPGSGFSGGKIPPATGFGGGKVEGNPNQNVIQTPFGPVDIGPKDAREKARAATIAARKRRQALAKASGAIATSGPTGGDPFSKPTPASGFKKAGGAIAKTVGKTIGIGRKVAPGKAGTNREDRPVNKAAAKQLRDRAERKLLEMGMKIPAVLKQRQRDAEATPGTADDILSLKGQIAWLQNVRKSRKWSKAALKILDDALRKMIVALHGLELIDETPDDRDQPTDGDPGDPGGDTGGDGGSSSAGASESSPPAPTAEELRDRDNAIAGIVNAQFSQYQGAQQKFWSELAPNAFHAAAGGGLELGSTALGAMLGYSPKDVTASRPTSLGEEPPPGWAFGWQKWQDYRHLVLTGKAGVDDWRGYQATYIAGLGGGNQGGPAVVQHHWHFNQHPDDPARWMNRAEFIS